MRRRGARSDRIEYAKLNLVDGRCRAQGREARSWPSRSNPYWMRRFALTVVCGATFPRRTWSSWLKRWSTRPPCQRAAATPRATRPRTWRARPRFPPCSLAVVLPSLAGATAITPSSTASSITAPANSTLARATSFCCLPQEAVLLDGELDTSLVRAFHVPANTLIEVYGSTLHYAPCQACADEGYKVLVALPQGTNGPKPALPRGAQGGDAACCGRPTNGLSFIRNPARASWAHGSVWWANIDIADSLASDAGAGDIAASQA